MKYYLLLLLPFVFLAACKQDKTGSATSFIAPEAGTRVPSGEELLIDLQFAGTVDSVVYLVDSTVVDRKADTTAAKASTTGLTMGNHLVIAKVYKGGVAEDVQSNIVVLAAKAPATLGFEIVNVFPHDSTSYVEGLEYHDGFFYESGGQYKQSTLRKTAVQTGKVLQKIAVPEQYFAEGITVIGDKIIQLTYKEGVGFVYDKNTFKKLGEFPYQAGVEGWGLTFDGTHILNTDGTNNIHFLNKDTYQKERSLEVYDNVGPVTALNELEYINGKIYANVYGKDVILVIDPVSGVVESQVDLSSLFPKAHNNETQRMDYVLNGIAWDAAGKRLFVTGKYWDKLYQIKLK